MTTNDRNEWRRDELAEEQAKALIDRALAEQRAEFEKVIAKLEYRFDAKLAVLEAKFATVEVATVSPTNTAPPTERGLPPLDRITRIEAMLWFNEKDPKFPKRARVQIKLYVWTCPPHMTKNYLKGNLTDDIFIPLHSAHHSEGRKRLRSLGIWPRIEPRVEDIARAGKWAGTNHLAAINQSNRLVITHGKDVLDFGYPRPKGTDQAEHAPAFRWFYPDPYIRADLPEAKDTDTE